ncbi:MAG: hypothetical protein KKA05_09995 [Alphaproteobacteria bacterium]|nr:hypothetical protein [Alphaproteobacteria bacterium]
MPNQQEDKSVKGKKQERRNGHAFHPIMSKGGVHEKTEKAKRKAAKHEMKRKFSEWLAVKGGLAAARLTSRSTISVNNLETREGSPKRTKFTLH